MKISIQAAKLNHLDKLRGFAAISVLVSHVIELTSWQSFATTGPAQWWRIGWAGVDIFFVISGLVIFLSAASLMKKETNWRKAFFIRRFFRIAPLYYLTGGVFLIFIIFPVFISWDIKSRFFQLTTHLLFIHNLFPTAHGSINGVNWSIGVEMQFYLLMLCLAPVLIKTKKPLIFLAILLSIAVFFRAFSWYLTHETGAFRTFQSTTQLPGTLDGFGFGILLGWLVLFRKEVFENRKIMWISLIIGAICFYYSTSIIFSSGGNYWNSIWIVSLFKTLFYFSIFCLIFFIIMMPPLPGFLDPVFDYFGKISYGIYLWHLPVIHILKTVLPQPGFTFLGYSLLLTFSCAVFSYHFLEKPWIDRAQGHGKKVIGTRVVPAT